MTYEIIKRNYERGLWNAQMVQVAVRAGVVTQEQADAIVSEAADTGSHG